MGRPLPTGLCKAIVTTLKKERTRLFSAARLPVEGVHPRLRSDVCADLAISESGQDLFGDALDFNSVRSIFFAKDVMEKELDGLEWCVVAHSGDDTDVVFPHA